MKYNTWPKSKRQVSRLGFGAYGLAGVFGHYDESYYCRSVLNCLEQGVTFIDTARGYGDSERIIGKALKEWNGDRPFIATKVRARVTNAMGWGMPIPVETSYPTGTIREDVETSLTQLGVEALDLVQLHQYWPQWDRSDYWMEELIRVKEEGKVRYIGVSIPDQRHDIALPIIQSGKIDSVQTVINIFDPLALDCVVPFCQENNVAVLARCVLDEGGLTGFLTEDIQFDDGDYRKSYFACVPRKMYMERVDRLRNFIPEHAKSLAELAIKFVLHHPGVTSAVVSMHIPEYANENIAAVDRPPLPQEVFDEIRKHHRWIRNFYDTKFW